MQLRQWLGLAGSQEPQLEAKSQFPQTRFEVGEQADAMYCPGWQSMEHAAQTWWVVSKNVFGPHDC